jgi:hypothetical protein
MPFELNVLLKVVLRDAVPDRFLQILDDMLNLNNSYKWEDVCPLLKVKNRPR